MQDTYQDVEEPFRNRTTSGTIVAPNRSPYPDITTCSHSISMCTAPVDGPCEIDCNGKMGGIYYLHNHGLKLYFPRKCSQQNIKIVIHVFLPEKSSVRQSLQIASAMFKFQSNIKVFDKAVTLRIPHYIKIESDQDQQNMCFVIQRGDNEPDIRKDGHFPIENSYGSLKITEFCKIFVAYDDSKLHSDENQDEDKFTVGTKNEQGQHLNQPNDSSCKLAEGQLIPPVNGVYQQKSQQFQNQQEKLRSCLSKFVITYVSCFFYYLIYVGDKIKYRALLALPLHRSHSTTSWRGAFYIFRSVVSWKLVS